jgi:hypothetical protein
MRVGVIQGAGEIGVLGLSSEPSKSETASRLRGRLNLKYGCHNRTRTYDPLINSQLLYQLSYVAMESDYTYRHLGAQA